MSCEINPLQIPTLQTFDLNSPTNINFLENKCNSLTTAKQQSLATHLPELTHNQYFSLRSPFQNIPFHFFQLNVKNKWHCETVIRKLRGLTGLASYP